MPIVRNNTDRLVRLIRAKVEAGVESAVLEGAEIYQRGAREKIYPPASVVGEYPAVRTGVGSASIGYSFDPSTVTGRFGVTNRALYMFWLVSKGRLGPVETYINYRGEMIRAFKRASSATN